MPRAGCRRGKRLTPPAQRPAVSGRAYQEPRREGMRCGRNVPCDDRQYGVGVGGKIGRGKPPPAALCGNGRVDSGSCRAVGEVHIPLLNGYLPGTGALLFSQRLPIFTWTAIWVKTEGSLYGRRDRSLMDHSSAKFCLRRAVAMYWKRITHRTGRSLSGRAWSSGHGAHLALQHAAGDWLCERGAGWHGRQSCHRQGKQDTSHAAQL